ncbi:protein of unknown function [Cupriavidus taiwanensis]|uniref:Uncharacterized protein n=1 Tax=Cupriavidus taiwanensis TaxID=164546 RepID=A0A375FKS8_9BURK|nr:protein of unknown function [Cupriavidus taiwanensis]SOZ01420.1 hypothetical protein CBM2595_A30283 [Cupriavidus taiwanensis]SOZ04316.1 hypothetical protein CBM2597_A50429 [Cupriavidus taiwanensis]SPC07109.1 hypothetical protein CT19431_160353 [Cupriavidus taiwanensis]SPC08957.1 hypothetical protein CBM2594_A40280 [Cupriavidus taiwanensis]
MCPGARTEVPSKGKMAGCAACMQALS